MRPFLSCNPRWSKDPVNVSYINRSALISSRITGLFEQLKQVQQACDPANRSMFYPDLKGLRSDPPLAFKGEVWLVQEMTENRSRVVVIISDSKSTTKLRPRRSNSTSWSAYEGVGMADNLPTYCAEMAAALPCSWTPEIHVKINGPSRLWLQSFLLRCLQSACSSRCTLEDSCGSLVHPCFTRSNRFISWSL